MKKIFRSRIAILIVLVTIVLIEIIAFGLSRARMIEEIDITIIDHDGLLGNEEGILNAIDNGESGYYIILPNIFADKWITKYKVEDSENPGTFLDVLPGTSLYLTEGEMTEKSVVIEAVYDKKEVGIDEYLYYKTVREEVEGRNISVSGYMPEDASIFFGELNDTEMENLISEEFDLGTLSVTGIYDIKLVANEEEYKFSEVEFELEEELIINISGMEDDKKYTLVSIEEIYDEFLEETTFDIFEIYNFDITGSEMRFTTSVLHTYVILEEQQTFMGFLQMFLSLLSSGMLVEADTSWDGSIATGFKYGAGTSGYPYLITDGSELAFLADRVNAGDVNYIDKHYQLTNDINLNKRPWTPIGTYSNSFRGVFDGAGRTISNIRIDITAIPANNTNATYGLFGSIGGVNTSRAVIKNLEITNSVINLPQTATTLGTASNNTTLLSVGSVAGIMYRNSTISNVIVKNSTISGTGIITKNHPTSSLYIGGIVGSALDTSGNINADPGGLYRYAIENCFSNVDIKINATCLTANVTLFNIGGIIGHIRMQPVWPVSCLYTGTITSANAMIGPIFGGLMAGTTAVNDTNRNLLWSGTDAGAVTFNNLYYTNYTVNSSTFTTTETTGSPANGSRISTTQTNIAYTQGVNKGQHTNDMNAMLGIFNTYVTNNNLKVEWKYSNGTFSLVERLTTTITEEPASTYNVVVGDNYDTSGTVNYNYAWYVDGTIDSGVTIPEYVMTPLQLDDINIEVVTDDGYYYTVSKFIIPKLEVQIRFNIDTMNHSVIATITGENVDSNDYTYQWYKTDISGLRLAMTGATGLTLDGLENGIEYELVATNNVNSGLSANDSFYYGNSLAVKTVIYVSSTANPGLRICSW